MNFELNKPYFIRTLTYHYVGELIESTPNGVILKKAAWIADSRRFTQALKTGIMEEVEVYTPPISLYSSRLLPSLIWQAHLIGHCQCHKSKKLPPFLLKEGW